MSKWIAPSAIIISNLLWGSLQMNAQDLSEWPPLEPEGSGIVGNLPDFVSDCRIFVEGTFNDADEDWRWGGSILTRSEKWGLVWRADVFYKREELSHFVNRVICWKGASKPVVKIAVGQTVAPLTVSK